MSSEAYHSHFNSFSSSQLKTILDDPEIFYKKYVIKEIEREEMSAFDIGTYFHTSILEPDKLQSECAVYTGVRRGKEWESFKLLHKGKAIITSSELTQAETIIKAVKASTIANEYLSKSKVEVSCFNLIYVYLGDVYCNGHILTEKGWYINETGYKFAQKKGVEILLKVRADALGEDFILDLKSTSGNVKNDHLMRSKVSSYSYDLSASLYLDMFSIESGKTYEKFIWTFASKDYGNCKNYVASEKNIKVGRAKYKKALVLLSEYLKNNWQFKDELSTLEPQFFELEHLNYEKGVDL